MYHRYKYNDLTAGSSPDPFPFFAHIFMDYHILGILTCTEQTTFSLFSFNCLFLFSGESCVRNIMKYHHQSWNHRISVLSFFHLWWWFYVSFQEKQGNKALTRACLFFQHWACGFGIRNEHDTLYFAMIYVSFTIIVIATTRSTFVLRPCFVFLRRSLKSWPNFCNIGNKLHGPLWPTVSKSSGRYYTPQPTSLEQKRGCATYMSTTATGEMLKKEHAAVTWKNNSPPRGVGPKTTYVQQELQEPPQKNQPL